MINDKEAYYHVATIIELDKLESESLEYSSEDKKHKLVKIYGKLEGDKTGARELHKIKFNSKNYTVKQAKEYLENQKLKPVKFEKAKTSDSDEVNTVNRYDVFDNSKEYMTTPFTETEEGFLTGRAIVTNTGIFNYTDREGNILKELRPPEEVFSSGSMNSLKMVPVTDNHPGKGVDLTNSKGLTVGYTGENVWRDDHVLSVPITITDEKTIKKIKDGKVALSCGYSAEMDFKSGFAFGNNKYDCVQRNIRYNHVAIVDRGRAGDLARIPFKMDSDAIFVDSKPGTEKINDKGDEIMKKIILDGVEYEAEAKVIEQIHKLTEDSAKKDQKIEDQGTEISKLQANNDTLKADFDKIKKESLVSDKDIQKAVKERLAIITIADSLNVEHSDETSNVELKKKVILSQYQDAKLDDKDEVYIDARFDAITEKLTEIVEKTTQANNNKAVLGGSIPKKNDSEDKKKQTKTDRYNEYCQKLENRHEEYKGAASV